MIRDSIKLNKPTKTRDGFLVASGIAARVGVLDYPENGFTAYVPADTLRKSAEGLEGLPLTLQHPQEGSVSPDNVEKHAVGAVRRSYFDEEDQALVVEVVIWRADAITAVEKKESVELSPGYIVVWEDYEDPEGKATKIQASRDYNHLSIVDEGRGGPNVRLNLDAKGNKIMTLEELAKLMADSFAAMNTRMDAYEDKSKDMDPDEDKSKDMDPDEDKPKDMGPDEDKPKDQDPDPSNKAADAVARLFRAHDCAAKLGLRLDRANTNLEDVERRVCAKIVGDAKAARATGAARSLLIEAELARATSGPKPSQLNGGGKQPVADAFDAGKLDMSRPASRTYLERFGKRESKRNSK